MIRSRWKTLAIASLLMIGTGCGGAEMATSPSREAPADEVMALATPPAAPASELTDGTATTTSMANGGVEAGEVPPDVPRKIIYSASIDLVVEHFDEAVSRVVQLVEQSGGYLAESDLGGTPGSHRQGRWKARVPVEKFEGFVEAVAALGELQRRQTDSQDVTEEYYDLEARIKNKIVEEERLIKHLEETTGKLKDILDVEKELSRVRGEIERLQGRQRLLTNLTSLTTVTISLQERLGYTPAAAPSLGDRIKHRFRASVDQLAWFGEWVVLALVSVVPWLPVWFVALAPTWLIIRRLQRRSRLASRADSGTIG